MTKSGDYPFKYALVKCQLGINDLCVWQCNEQEVRECGIDRCQIVKISSSYRHLSVECLVLLMTYVYNNVMNRKWENVDVRSAVSVNCRFEAKYIKLKNRLRLHLKINKFDLT